MSMMDYTPDLTTMKKVAPADEAVMRDVLALRDEARRMISEENHEEAGQKIEEALRKLRDVTDYANVELRAMVVVLLFDIAEIHFSLKDYKQSKKELEMIFKLLEPLVKEDGDRFGPYHVLAMELSTRILRSRKKMLELLAKQQLHTGLLYEKVNAGVAAATDKLVESLRKGAEMLASTGDYNGAIKFYMEAIKLSKKRTGRVTRRDVAMTIEMARLMMKSRRQSERAKRLLNAVLPHAVSLEVLELEQEILNLLKQTDENLLHEPLWRSFMEKITRRKISKGNSTEDNGEEEPKNGEDESSKEK